MPLVISEKKFQVPCNLPWCQRATRERYEEDNRGMMSGSGLGEEGSQEDISQEGEMGKPQSQVSWGLSLRITPLGLLCDGGDSLASLFEA